MQRLYLYARWLRAWHWLNAALFIVLIVTGLSMHFSDLERPIVSFATATTVHNTLGLALVALYVFFVLGNFISGNRRHYVVDRRSLLGDVFRQVRFYLVGIMRGDPHPFEATEQRKFNPMQQVAYISVMVVMMPVLLVTGLLLQFPDLAPDKVLGAGGIWPMAVLHSVVAFLVTLFLVVHVYLGSTGETATTLYKNMVTGWHEVHEADEAPPEGDERERVEAHEANRASEVSGAAVAPGPVDSRARAEEDA